MIAPDETSATITIQVGADNVFEADETFFVNLTNPGGATLTDAQGLGTILNDDVACAPNVRMLSNGDPTTTDGALRIPVDGLGAAGDDAAGSALYNPPGALAARSSSLFYGGLYASNKDQFLADCLSATSTVISESVSSLTTSAQVGDLGLVLTQSVAPVAADGSSRLTQRYELRTRQGRRSRSCSRTSSTR